MLIFPKIVIKDGESQYQFDDNHISNPSEIAAQLVKSGFSWLYVQSIDSQVDQDVIDCLAKIIDVVDVPVAFEGAVQDIQTVDRLMGEGVSRIILNNLALTDHPFIQEACELYPDQIAVHLHTDQGKVPAAESSDKIIQFDLSKIALNIAEYGAYALFYSEINLGKDESLDKPGLDMSACSALAQKLSIPVIYAGKLNHMEDLLSIVATGEKNIAGALIGDGLYSGQISAADALQISAGLSLYQQKSNDN